MTTSKQALHSIDRADSLERYLEDEAARTVHVVRRNVLAIIDGSAHTRLAAHTEGHRKPGEQE